MAQDFSSESISMGTSGHVLQNHAIHAITDHIVDVRNQLLGLDTRMLVHPILDTILQLSKTREEGSWPRGKLIFVDPEMLDHLNFIAKIQRHERPVMANVKHIRKLLLSVEFSNRKLVSDGHTIIGISDSDIPPSAISVRFSGEHGFLELQGKQICSFYDGSFHSSTRKAKLVELEELLLDSSLDTEVSTALFCAVHQPGDHLEKSRGHFCIQGGIKQQFFKLHQFGLAGG